MGSANRNIDLYVTGRTASRGSHDESCRRSAQRHRRRVARGSARLPDAPALSDAWFDVVPQLKHTPRISLRPVPDEPPSADNVTPDDDDDDHATGDASGAGDDPLAADGAIPTVPMVLHVDADPDCALALAMLLQPEAQVSHATSLAGAMALLDGARFDLLVLDPDLPDGDGVALLAALAGVPVLLYATQFPDWRTRADAFLLKRWTSHRQLWITCASLLGLDAELIIRGPR